MLADNLPDGRHHNTLQPMTTQRIAEAPEPTSFLLNRNIAVFAAQLLVCR
jgi:hypothetical protein